MTLPDVSRILKLLAIHAPSAICPIIVLTPYILLNMKGNFKHSLGIALAFRHPRILDFLFNILYGLQNSCKIVAKGLDILINTLYNTENGVQRT